MGPQMPGRQLPFSERKSSFPCSSRVVGNLIPFFFILRHRSAFALVSRSRRHRMPMLSGWTSRGARGPREAGRSILEVRGSG